MPTIDHNIQGETSGSDSVGEDGDGEDAGSVMVAFAIVVKLATGLHSLATGATTLLLGAIAAISLLVGGHRGDEHHAGFGAGENQRDRHPQSSRSQGA